MRAIDLTAADMKTKPRADSAHTGLVNDLGRLVAEARGSAARLVNTVMTAAYWEVGRRIVEFEQSGAKRAGYGGGC